MVSRVGTLLAAALFGLSTAVQFGIYDLGEDPGGGWAEASLVRVARAHARAFALLRLSVVI
jgi:hypothetical protein